MSVSTLGRIENRKLSILKYTFIIIIFLLLLLLEIINYNLQLFNIWTYITDFANILKFYDFFTYTLKQHDY